MPSARKNWAFPNPSPSPRQSQGRILPLHRETGLICRPENLGSFATFPWRGKPDLGLTLTQIPQLNNDPAKPKLSEREPSKGEWRVSFRQHIPADLQTAHKMERCSWHGASKPLPGRGLIAESPLARRQAAGLSQQAGPTGPPPHGREVPQMERLTANSAATILSTSPSPR